MKYSEISNHIDDSLEILTGRCILRGDDLNSAEAYTRGWLMAQLLLAIEELAPEQQEKVIERMQHSALYVNVER